MARKISGNQDTFPCQPGAAIPARRVVVMDAVNRGGVKLPAITTPEKTAVGVTTSAQSAANNIAVQYLGIGLCESDGSGVINPGDYVIVESAIGLTGRVKSQAFAAGGANVYDIIGMCVDHTQVPAVAGAYVSVLLFKQPSVAA